MLTPQQVVRIRGLREGWRRKRRGVSQGRHGEEAVAGRGSSGDAPSLLETQAEVGPGPHSTWVGWAGGDYMDMGGSWA